MVVVHSFMVNTFVQVVCRMLGYEGEASAHGRAGRGVGPMWQLALDCLGHEEDLQNCRVRIISKPCRRMRSAGVECSNE